MFITHNPLIPTWRKILGSSLLFWTIATPVLIAYQVARLGLTSQNAVMLMTGVILCGCFLAISQMISALPARIILRLRGGPRNMVSPEDLLRRLERAAFILAAWRRAMGVTDGSERLEIQFNRTKPGDPVTLEFFWPVLRPSSNKHIKHPVVDYLDDIIMGTEDSRAFDAYVKSPDMMGLTTPLPAQMSEITVTIPDSASLSNHAVLEANALLHERNLLKLPPSGYPPQYC